MERGTAHTGEAGGSIWSKRTGRRAILKGAALAGAAGLTGPLLRSTGGRAAAASDQPLLPANLYTISYYPANNAGYPMWQNYNGAQYQKDMATAKALGFNTVRIFLAAMPGLFDFPQPAQTELDNLTDFYNRARAVGVKLHLNLFDFWSQFGHIAGSQTWFDAIIGALPDTSALAVVEVKNEVKFASTKPYAEGYDAGWLGNRPVNAQVGQVALGWAQDLIPYIKSHLPDTPVTISTTTDRAASSNPNADLAAFVGAVYGTDAAPAWYDQHIYVGTTPGLIYNRIQSAIETVTVNNVQQPLVCGETGCTSTPTSLQGKLQAQQQEADYLQACRWYCAQAGLPDPGVWTLFDLNPSSQFTSGQMYGLYDVNGNIKLSGQMYQSIPAGATVPAIPVNGTMQGGDQEDAKGNELPPRWYLSFGADNDQIITSAIDKVNTYQGNPSIKLTYYNMVSGDTPPALMTNPITAPIPASGDSYTWAVYLKASGSYGQPNLKVYWYGSNDLGSVLLSTTDGPTLTLTDSFAQYSLESTTPSGALYATLAVNVRNSTSAPESIWVANATWGQPPS